ncbi:hypothetical protein HA402_012874 [Bradysia odoriphaga]|nr:hypothetical protein HA402_012874 [Bradysia odoriphaga]
MKDCIEFMSSHKTPFYAWIGRYLLIVIDNPDDAYTVLTSKSCMEKSATYKFFNRIGLLTAPVHIWKPMRKLLNSAFNVRILQSFVPVFNEKSTYLIKNIDRQVGEGTFDILKLLHSCTLDMICSTTLGVNLDSQSGKNGDYLYAWKTVLALICKRMVNVFHYSDFIYRRSKEFQMEQKYNEAMDALPQKIIEQKKKEYFVENPTPEELPDANDDDDGLAYDKPQIFINKLFRLYGRKGIDEKGIRDQVNMMIFAGNDTSALTTAHAILLLAMHPDIQERAAEEVDQVCEDIPMGDPLTYNHVSKLVYVEQILLEAMRLYPIAPYIFRLCQADTKIRECTIPRGTTVAVSVYDMHRKPEIWARPNDFYPDHFHPDEVRNRSPYAFAAFSLGPRNCIGMQYGKISMKIMVAMMLRHFRFSTHLKMSDIRPKIEITLKLACGDLVQVERRCKMEKATR